MIWLAAQPLILLLLYSIVIQYRRESLPSSVRTLLYWCCAPVLVYDALLNLTIFNLIFWEFPKKVDGKFEYTLSDRLARLVRGSGWRYSIANLIRILLDYIDPTGKHIA